MKLKYRIVPEGAANGVVPINLVFIDKKDVDEANITYKEACEIVGKDLGDDCASIDILDMDAVTVTSDGIMADGAVVAFASVDHGKINVDFGFLNVSEIPYSYTLKQEEPHMKQWDTAYYRGRRLYRGPSAEDRIPRDPHNENMTMSGRIANNNTGSEMMNLVDMTEILVPYFGMMEIMKDEDGAVLVDAEAGPEVSVGIGMVVRERQGRIFGWQYGAGMTAHRSGVYAKTVKSDYPAVAGDKKVIAEYTIRALEAGMVPGLHIGSSPVVLSIAKAMGYPIAYDNITENAWIELESVGLSREELEKPVDPMTREEVLARADEVLPGLVNGVKYKASEICQIRYAEI